MTEYSRRELKRMLRLKCAPVDAPAWIFKRLEEMRKEMNRQTPSLREEADTFMREYINAKPYVTAKSLRGRMIIAIKKGMPGWVARMRETLLDIFYD